MRRRAIGMTALAVALGVVAQAQTTWTPPRTPDGHPDLQGQWDFGTATPLERPKEFAGKAFLTAEEAADFERRTAERLSQVVTVHAPGWLDYGTKVVPDRRSSLIIDPPDGRVPPLTPAARQKVAARREVQQPEIADNPEDRTPQERCLVFGAGPPLVPGPYNNNLQVVQTPDAVVLFTEMIHDARIVPLDGRPQPAANVTFWLGSSRGRWDGDTLVIDTTNFGDKVTFRGSDERLHVVERLRLDGPDALRYEYTIDDPTAFTHAWSAAFTMRRSDAMLYEFACHEGNYGLMNIMRAARAVDRDRGTAAAEPRK